MNFSTPLRIGNSPERAAKPLQKRDFYNEMRYNIVVKSLHANPFEPQTQYPAVETAVPKAKTLEKRPEWLAMQPAGDLARQTKGGSSSVSQIKDKTYSWSLVDDKGTWSVRVRLVDELTGKVRHKSKSTGLKVKDGTKRQAKLRAADIAKELAEAPPVPVEAAPEPQEFSYYVEEWLDNRDLLVRANTVKSYRDYAKTHILPALGRIRVDQITWRILQKFCDRQLATHTKATVKKYFIVIRGALDDAMRDGVIQMNPERLVRWPKAERISKAKALTQEEAGRLLKAAEAKGEPVRAAVTLALCYGLRRSEVCGLRWMDIDFQRKTMHIRHTVTQNGTVLLDEDHTKTRGSNRVLSLIDWTIPYLKQLRMAQMEAGFPMDKVVVWPDGRTARPDGISRTFQTLLKANDFEHIRFHDLRHTAATLLAEAGLQPKHLQAFLGHDDIEMTMAVYVHVSPTAAAETSQKMNEVLERAINRAENCSEMCSERLSVVNFG